MEELRQHYFAEQAAYSAAAIAAVAAAPPIVISKTKPVKNKVCLVPNCENNSYVVNGLCRTHYDCYSKAKAKKRQREGCDRFSPADWVRARVSKK
jgi:hypothetical protein